MDNRRIDIFLGEKNGHANNRLSRILQNTVTSHYMHKYLLFNSGYQQNSRPNNFLCVVALLHFSQTFFFFCVRVL